MREFARVNSGAEISLVVFRHISNHFTCISMLRCRCRCRFKNAALTWIEANGREFEMLAGFTKPTFESLIEYESEHYGRCGVHGT